MPAPAPVATPCQRNAEFNAPTSPEGTQNTQTGPLCQGTSKSAPLSGAEKCITGRRRPGPAGTIHFWSQATGSYELPLVGPGGRDLARESRPGSSDEGQPASRDDGGASALASRRRRFAGRAEASITDHSRSYSSWRRHQKPVSLRPSGARSSHWYMPQRASTPRSYVE